MGNSSSANLSRNTITMRASDSDKEVAGLDSKDQKRVIRAFILRTYKNMHLHYMASINLSRHASCVMSIVLLFLHH
jgi:hypothetical protein